jgi:urease accessory protein
MISELRLHIEQRRERSIMTDYYVTPPLKILALPHTVGKGLELMQMSASPGLLDSDEQNITLTLEANTQLQLFTQAYQRVFAMHNHAQQNTALNLKANSSLVYTPHPLVLHEGAHLKLTNTIHLEDNAHMVWSEIITSGRKHRGESFAFKQLSSLTKIHHRQKLILRDNLQWQPERHVMSSPVHMGEFSHQATVYYANTHANFNAKDTLNTLYTYLNELNEVNQHGIYFGMSQAHPHLIVMRMLAQHGELLYETVRDLAKVLSSIHKPAAKP